MYGMKARQLERPSTHSTARALTTRLAWALILLLSLPLAGQTESDRRLNDVKVLSAPNMEGRGDGSKGLTQPPT